MLSNKQLIGLPLSILAAACALALIGAGAAGAAVTVKNITLAGTASNADNVTFSWAGMPNPWDPNPNDISVKSGSTKFYFVWPFGINDPGSHNVTLKKTGAANWKSGICTSAACTKTTSSTSVKFTTISHGSNTGSTNLNFPSLGWTPTAPRGKKYLYALYCTYHSAMKMRVYVTG